MGFYAGLDPTFTISPGSIASLEKITIISRLSNHPSTPNEASWIQQPSQNNRKTPTNFQGH
jgi:hypothetical protein